MKPPRYVRLFVKPYCGWCQEARDWLDERQIAHEVIDVMSDPAAQREMQELSGQSLAPVLDADGAILADFDTDQLEAFWDKLSDD